ncbi:MAG TPA: ankyrin repeat domain-containing protein [Vicinamibacterales bacterium]|nr:ankyrin repeat domain-containing protein [Vicinamibacterales bacterium]
MTSLKYLTGVSIAVVMSISGGTIAAQRASGNAAVNAVEPDGTTPLHRAVHRNDLKATDTLIRAGADVNAANRYGVPPLSLAATNGNAAVLELLLKAGADPNATQSEGETALMTAARTGVPAAVKALLAHGADVNAKESWRGQTALMWAAAEGHAEVIQLLLEAGAQINARSTAGWTALLFAAREGKIPALKALLAGGADVDDALVARPGRGRGAGAAGAAAVGPAGAGPRPPARGTSALVLAVGSGHFELAATLLDAGADPNAAAQGWTALHHLTWIRKPGTGSNDPAPYGSGTMDSLTLVRKLKAHGADVNARVTRRPNVGVSALNFIGATPFSMAARGGDTELMRLLVELGADPLLPNEDGTTPLMVAAGVGTNSPGEDAGAPPEALDAVKLALELGGDVNVVDKNGNTAMHGAAFKQLPDVVRLLDAKGADIAIWNKKNVSGWTPLRIAVGVHRGMNLRFHVPTADALKEIMIRAGVSTEVEPETIISGATPTK